MLGRLDSIRDALTRNEIIFKTVAATLLSIMALIVSFAQLLTAHKQASLSELQEKIAEAQALPQFEVAIHQKINNDTGKFDDGYLEVVNAGGGPVHEFSAETASFLRVSAVMPYLSGSLIPSRVGSAEFDMPVDGYFLTQGVSPAGKGLLVTISGFHNDAAVNALSKSATEAADKAKWDALHLETRIYVKLRYRDMLDRSHIDYYEAPSVGSGWRLEDPAGEAIFKKWEQIGRPDLSKLTAEQILGQATKHIDGNTGNAPKEAPQ